MCTLQALQVCSGLSVNQLFAKAGGGKTGPAVGTWAGMTPTRCLSSLLLHVATSHFEVHQDAASVLLHLTVTCYNCFCMVTVLVKDFRGEWGLHHQECLLYPLQYFALATVTVHASTWANVLVGQLMPNSDVDLKVCTADITTRKH